MLKESDNLSITDMEEDKLLAIIRSVLEDCAQNRFDEAEKTLASINAVEIENYPPDHVALFALASEATANIPRALEDAVNLYNEIIYQRRTTEPNS